MPNRVDFKRNKLSCAILSAITATAVSVPVNAQIEEIIVTATKRAENAQDVPITVQAVGGDTLRELRIETFDKYVEYLPNVVSAGNGPGKKELYIRGSATEQTSVTISSAQGSAPGVALYLDEQPVSFGGRNLDVYAVDMQRIEVLSGPQGTLFGASSQSGNVRLITNKPVQGEVQGGINAKYGNTKSGSDSYSVDAFLNVPITERLAARIVLYNDDQGGWIDNIPATFTPSGEVIDRNNVAGYGPLLTGADSIATARNDDLVENNWNEATYRGGRAALAFEINDDWNVLVQHTYQELDVDGVFLVDTSLGGEESSARFSEDYNEDEFGLTTWTLNGRIGNLDVIYTGGYLDRDVESVIDYTHYNNGGGYITYYLCSGNIYDSTGLDPNNCFDPTKLFVVDMENTRMTHEFRISTDPANRLRVLGGAYYNDVETTHLGEFVYPSTNEAFSEHISSYYNDNSGDGFLLGNTTVPTAGANTSGPRSSGTVFFNDYTRNEEEWAIFGEFAFDFSDTLTTSFSARYYDLTSQLQGASNFSFGCRYGIEPQGFGNSERTADGRCNSHAFSNDVTARLQTLGQYNNSGDDSIILDARSANGARDMFRGGGSNQATLDAIKNGHLNISKFNSDGSVNESDVIMKLSLSWQPIDDWLVFMSYAEGYRPATLNRSAGQLSANQTGIFENYVVPAVAETDNLTSYEIGMKSVLFNGSLRLNASLYQTDISGLQVSRFDPSNVAFMFFVENVGDAETKGLDADFQWAPSTALTISGAFSLLDTEITKLNPQLAGIVVPEGSELPLSPTFSGNLRARYDFPFNAIGGNAYVLASVNHRGESVSGVIGGAEFMDDTLFRQSGSYSGLKLQEEDGTYGTVSIPDGSGGSRLPKSSRFVNPSATTLNVAFGLESDNWGAEVFVDNVNNEDGRVMQIAGHYTPVVSVQRPRTIGLRLSYNY